MPSLHPFHRNRLAYYKLPQPVTLAQIAPSNPGIDSDHPSHSTRLSSHLAPRNLGSPCQPTISVESKQSRTKIHSSSQFPKQNRMATSSQRPIQQSMDSDSGTTHSEEPRNTPREIVQRPLAQTHPASSCSGPTYGTYGSIARKDDLHGREKDKKECKRLEKLEPRVLALYSKVDSLLACQKPISELPIQERLKLHSRELESWIQELVIPAVKSEPSPTLLSTFVVPTTPSQLSSLLQGPTQ